MFAGWLFDCLFFTAVIRRCALLRDLPVSRVVISETIQQEGQQPWDDEVRGEFTVEALSRCTCRFQSRRLGIQQVDERGGCPNGVVEGPEAAFDTVLEKFRDGTNIPCHDGKASRHCLDDRKAE